MMCCLIYLFSHTDGSSIAISSFKRSLNTFFIYNSRTATILYRLYRVYVFVCLHECIVSCMGKQDFSLRSSLSSLTPHSLTHKHTHHTQTAYKPHIHTHTHTHAPTPTPTPTHPHPHTYTLISLSGICVCVHMPIAVISRLHNSVCLS